MCASSSFVIQPATSMKNNHCVLWSVCFGEKGRMNAVFPSYYLGVFYWRISGKLFFPFLSVFGWDKPSLKHPVVWNSVASHISCWLLIFPLDIAAQRITAHVALCLYRVSGLTPLKPVVNWQLFSDSNRGNVGSGLALRLQQEPVDLRLPVWCCRALRDRRLHCLPYNVRICY